MNLSKLATCLQARLFRERLLSITMFSAMVLLTSSLPLRAEEPIDIAKTVAPIFAKHCVRCHRPDQMKGDVDLTTASKMLAQELIAPGKPNESRIIQVIRSHDNQPPEMPREAKPLSEAEVATLERWVADGAVWPDGLVVKESSRVDGSWWSLQPLQREAPPHIPHFAEPAWQSHPIDRFLAQRLDAAGLKPNGTATRRELIRRATYDLHGLPPTPDEIEAFEADRSPLAYERLLDRLLASPRYGERWGRHWLDVVRFGESRGYERNEIITNLWPFRDYVIRSFNDDVRFDQLVREHLTGDQIAKDQPDREVGVCYLVAGPYDDVGNQDPVQAAQIRANTIDEVISATSEAFLGLTLGCARCHDHKFDPLTQADYYSLYATFAGVRHGPRVVATESEKRSRAHRVQPLEAEKAAAQQEQQKLEQTIKDRATANTEALSANWKRGPISRQGVTEEFAPVKAAHVKLTVLGQEENPAARSNYRIEEFEVWTADEGSRNVALTKNGGRATGNSRSPGDFGAAYSADLVIDGQFGACWIAAGPELVISFAQPEVINRISFSSDRAGAAGAVNVANFVSEYRLSVSEDGQHWTEVANSLDRQPISEVHRQYRLYEATINDEERKRIGDLKKRVAELQRELESIPPLPVVWAGNFENPAGPFHLFRGGDPQRLGDVIKVQSPAILQTVSKAYEVPADQPESQRRIAFSSWLTQADNPLTSRVLVNRIWQNHFGTGIVDTPSDFGAMGSLPSHPELLDYMASELLRNDWHIKPLHRLIMTSAAYQQSSANQPAAYAVDTSSRLLWRYPPRRLTAEELRDTLLSVTGVLNSRQGGPGFRLYEYQQDNVATYVPLDRVGPETFRRAVYHHNARAARVDLFTEFDGPDCAFGAPKRSATVTPLQALALFNHRFSVTMAEALAARLEREFPSPANASPAVSDATPPNQLADTLIESRVRLAYQLVYGRAPDRQELELCCGAIQQQGMKTFCRALLNSSELLYLQ